MLIKQTFDRLACVGKIVRQGQCGLCLVLRGNAQIGTLMRYATHLDERKYAM